MPGGAATAAPAAGCSKPMRGREFQLTGSRARSLRARASSPWPGLACGLALLASLLPGWPGAAAAEAPATASPRPEVQAEAPSHRNSDASAPRRPRIGLVLSGGGARGAAHIGVLKVLEELRVPIDYIAGTSMGSIVGGAYASGQNLPDMMRDVAQIKTETLAHDKPPRQDISTHLKQEDWLGYFGPQFGYRDGSLLLPKGAISGVALEAVLRDLAQTKGDWNFDRLPIPFRAIATDVVSGQMTVLASGDLATAMRASMSVPGAVAPVQIDGKLLVDGGLTRNLPVDIARGMGAEVIIAVNLGTPLLKRDQITSALSVAAQMLNILTEQNVQASLASLGPQDVLILPELGDYSAGNFDDMPSTIPIGEAAARKVAAQLARLSLPPQQYAQHRQQQLLVVAQDTRAVDEIRVAGLSRVNQQVVVQSMQTHAGEVLDIGVLDSDMRRIYGRGDFEHVGYSLADLGGRRVLTVEAVEKSWGPDYVRFGLSLASDFGGDNAFNVLASYRRTWLNHLGGEWRTDVQFGNFAYLYSEFYQPLVPSQYVFIAPRVQVGRWPAYVYGGANGSTQVAQYVINSALFGLDIGTQFTKYGELRVGFIGGRGSSQLQIGDPILQAFDVTRNVGAIRTRLYLDQLDSVTLPRSGYSADLKLVNNSTALGASDSYGRWTGDFIAATSWGANTLQLALVGGGKAGGPALPAYDYLNFGGFMRMTGYKDDQLRNDSMAYGRLVYMNKLADLPLLEGVYAGASLEAAQLGKPLIPHGINGSVASAGLFFAVDTPLGPAYLAYGRTLDGNSSAYFYLGRR